MVDFFTIQYIPHVHCIKSIQFRPSVGSCWRARVSTSRVDGPSTRPVNSASGNSRPSTRPVLTGNGNRSPVNSGSGNSRPSTRPVLTGNGNRSPVNSGSGNRALLSTRPAHTFPTKEHHRPLASTKLYCLVTEARVCEQLAQGHYMKVERPVVEPWPLDHESNALTTTPPRHTCCNEVQ